MNAKEETHEHEERQGVHQRDLLYRIPKKPERVPTPPARDDRGERRPWRPGDR